MINLTNVLIVEDDPFMQRTIKRVFELNKYQVELASDGQEGVIKARKLNPKLILLDILMLRMNGIEALKKLKEEEITKKIPVVVLTNVTDEPILNKVKNMGAIDCLIKSDVSPDQIVDKAAAYL